MAKDAGKVYCGPESKGGASHGLAWEKGHIEGLEARLEARLAAQGSLVSSQGTQRPPPSLRVCGSQVRSKAREAGWGSP